MPLPFILHYYHRLRSHFSTSLREIYQEPSKSENAFAYFNQKNQTHVDMNLSCISSTVIIIQETSFSLIIINIWNILPRTEHP